MDSNTAEDLEAGPSRGLHFEAYRLYDYVTGHGPDPHRVVLPAVQNYLADISKIPQSNKRDEWIKVVMAALNDFGEMKFARELKLGITVIDFHQSRTASQASDTNVKKSIDSFSGLNEYLTETAGSPHRSQWFFLSYDRMTFGHSLGFSKRHVHFRSATDRFRTISTITLAFIGAKWNLRPEFLLELSSDQSGPPNTYSTKLELPSKCRVEAFSEQLKTFALPVEPQVFASDSGFWLSNPHLRCPDSEAITVFYDAALVHGPAINGGAGSSDGSEAQANQEPSDHIRNENSVAAHNPLAPEEHIEQTGQMDEGSVREDQNEGANQHHLPTDSGGLSQHREQEHIAWRCIIKSKDSELQKELVNRLLAMRDFRTETPWSHLFLDHRSPIRLIVDLCIDRVFRQLEVIDRLLEVQRFQGRQRPSYSRINHVLHLRDQLDLIISSAKAIATEPLDWGYGSGPGYVPESWSNASKTDAKYLSKRANTLKNKSFEISKLIANQLQSQTSYRTTVLTILATVYIPLSFATGIFGMNIKEINDGTPRWWAVVATGLPLVLLTIVVPLFFDSLFHVSMATARSRKFQSVALIFVFLIFIILFVSHNLPAPWFSALHLDAIPIFWILCYAARKWYVFWNTEPKTEWRFYCFFFFYTLAVGLLNELFSTFVLLPFFIAILPMLGYWWKRDRLKAWWLSRKKAHQARQGRGVIPEPADRQPSGRAQ